jgi:hypothetical protein
METIIGPEPDARWKAMHGIENYQQYLEKAGNPVLLMQTVDEDVQGIFKLVNKLTGLAYYEYECWDLACMKALLALELALKKRYLQLHGTGIPKGMNLKALIEWFRKNDYFETDSALYLDQIRMIRNHFAHPDYHSFGGPMISWHITAAVSLINDLYEDRDLRLQRKEETRLLNDKLQPMLEQGMVLTIKGSDPVLVYRFVAGFIDNKKADPLFHFVYRPAFELPKEYQKGDSVPVYDAHTVCCNDCSFSDDGAFTGSGKDSIPIFTLAPAAGSAADLWNEWNKAYQTYVNVLPHFELRDNRSIGERIAQIKWEFHY